MRTTPAPAHFLRTDPSKKSVRWGSVKAGVLISGSGGPALKSGPPELFGGRSPFRYEISQELTLDCMARLKVQLKLSQLCCPLGDVARGVGVVQDRSQRVRGRYDNSVCLKVVAQFPGRNKYG